ncbi:hypothetical protein BCR39DRAFT_503201 [Naematelia encephala]|uniref:Uncharacterized protein n=1 Tax=Naematelia encephala TaxID=71784 RepID=A0A1Y2BJA4_9TREE|nr:hypothetical protein BCR39DRAFT_503201 [Naematelia encephala]
MGRVTANYPVPQSNEVAPYYSNSTSRQKCMSLDHDWRYSIRFLKDRASGSEMTIGQVLEDVVKNRFKTPNDSLMWCLDPSQDSDQSKDHKDARLSVCLTESCQLVRFCRWSENTPEWRVANTSLSVKAVMTDTRGTVCPHGFFLPARNFDDQINTSFKSKVYTNPNDAYEFWKMEGHEETPLDLATFKITGTYLYPAFLPNTLGLISGGVSVDFCLRMDVDNLSLL